MDGIQGITQPTGADVQSAEVQAAENFVAAHPGGPSTDTSLADLRWEGMSNAQLAAAVQQLNSGTGAADMTAAADALANVAADLSQINDTLQTQLQAIGVNWQSQTASDLADQMLSASAAYGGTVTDQGGQSSTAINQQAEAYATARNTAPKPLALTSNTQPSTTAPFTGHGTDQAQQAGQANAARNQAVDAMNNYTSTSQSNLGGYSPPPAPPAIGLNPQPSGGTTVSGYPGAPGTGGGGVGGVGTLPPGVPGGGGGVSPILGGGSGGSGSVPIGGSGGASSGVGIPGGISGGGAGGASGIGPGGISGGFPGGGLPGGGFPSSGGPGGGSSVPPGSGPASGIGPIGGGPGSSGVGGVGGSGPVSRAAGMPLPAGAGEDIGEIAAGAAVAGGTAAVGIVGANANRRGGEDEEITRDNEPGGFADDDDDFNPNRSALAELDGEQAAAARMNAELSASEPVAPGLLEPVHGRREDDAERRDPYAATDDEFFDDGRMVIPEVLGGNSPSGRSEDDDEQDA
jgi:hypothetical protein